MSYPLKKQKGKKYLFWGMFFTVVCIILGAISALISVKSWQKGFAIDAELLRAQNYAIVQDEDKVVDGTDDSIEFSAFFLRDIDGDGYAEPLLGTCKEVRGQDTLYMEINVKSSGYLKEGTITIDGKNFYLYGTIPKDYEVEQNYFDTNIKEIKLKKINNGTQKIIMGKVRSGDYTYSSSNLSALNNDIDNYSRNNNKVILNGIYVDDEGNEKEISKEIKLTVDWYGDVKAGLSYYNTSGYIDEVVDEENGIVKIDFSVEPYEINDKLILKNSTLTGIIPKLNGYLPSSFKISGNNVDYNYDENTGQFEATIDAILNEDNTVKSNAYSRKTNSQRYSTYNFSIEYPIEAYTGLDEETFTLKFPVNAFFEGYNNPNDEFTNPYVSNVVSDIITYSCRKKVIPHYDYVPTVYPPSFYVDIGEYVGYPYFCDCISKIKPLNIYNEFSSEEDDDFYIVEWRGYSGTNGIKDGVILKENKNEREQEVDKFINSDLSEISMDNITTNAGIYLSNASNCLGQDGWIKVYNDETNELLVTFNKYNWNTYNSTKPYLYTMPVKHIRVETSEWLLDKSIYIYNVKELDDEYITQNFTIEEFNDFKKIKTALAVYSNGELLKKDYDSALYIEPYSEAKISISKNIVSTHETEYNEEIVISTNEITDYKKGWINGSFLVKLPKELIAANIKNVSINNNKVKITSYELINDDENYYIKINTSNDEEQRYDITIVTEITPNPTMATSIGRFELYASNGISTLYGASREDIYDVNNNLNIKENINYDSTAISFIAPASLITTQIAKEYDGDNVAVAPQIAEMPKGQKTAIVELSVTNNYSNTISEVVILGKIPFEGNSYVFNQSNLQSEFSVVMANTGIIVPDNLKDVVKIYYTENANATKDLSDSANGWIASNKIRDLSKIKMFMIDFGDYTLSKNEIEIFKYQILMPEDLDLNLIAYSQHGVHFCLDTDEGKYKTKTEPSKLGFEKVEKFDLELTKYQVDSDVLVQGATYGIYEEVLEDSALVRTMTTNENGIAQVQGILVGKNYIIKEINSLKQYALNQDIIKFTTYLDENENVKFVLNEGTLREGTNIEIEEAKEAEGNDIIKLQVEDEVKPSIKIIKTERNTENRLSKVKYKITGKDISQAGKILTTNGNGEVIFDGLCLNEVYVLEEIKADKYYLAEPLKFKIININGVYTLQIISGEIKNYTTERINDIPCVNLELEDDKIPTYTLQIDKIKKVTNVVVNENVSNNEQNDNNAEIEHLQGATFKLYKENRELGTYITDENGIITIPDLYQYESNRGINQTYLLREITAPDGYVNVKDIVFKVESIDGTLKFEEELNDGQTEKRYTVDGTTIKLIVEDSPTFKLIKKDGETGNALSNIKFAIYNVDDGETPAKNGKGEIIGEKNIINGKEYYIVETNINGELTASLPEGFYRIVEIEAPSQYNIEGKEYYIGIGVSRKAKTNYEYEWSSVFGDSRSEKITTSVAETPDKGLIAVGRFNTITLPNGELLTSNGYSDGMIIKYNEQGDTEWIKTFGGDNYEYMTDVKLTPDGGFLASGYYSSSSIDFGNGIVIDNVQKYYNGRTYQDLMSNKSTGMLLKYNEQGELQWVKKFGGYYEERIERIIVMPDGNIIITGYSYSNIFKTDDNEFEVGNNTSIRYGFILCYNSIGELQWFKNISSTSNAMMTSITELPNDGLIATGYFSGTINLVDSDNNPITVTSNGTDGLIIKLSDEGSIEWVKAFGGNKSDQLFSVASSLDGGFVVGGISFHKIIQNSDGTYNFSYTSSTTGSIVLVKYDSNGEIEWIKQNIGNAGDCLYYVCSTSDGGYLASGAIRSSQIELDNGRTLLTKANTSYRDGILLKYDDKGNVEWAKAIGDSNEDYISTVIETSDGGLAFTGYISSYSVYLEDGITVNSKVSGVWNSIVIKFKRSDLPNVLVKQTMGIGQNGDDFVVSIDNTLDEGIIVGGHFSNSLNIQDKTIESKGLTDGIIIKYDRNNKIDWFKQIGGVNNDQINFVIGTQDGGVIVVGEFCNSIELESGYIITSNGDIDGFAIKYDSNGEMQWVKTIGGSSIDTMMSVCETFDNGCIIVGNYSSSSIQFNGDVILNNAGSNTADVFMVKYDENGEFEWAKSIGGNKYESAKCVCETSDGDIILSCTTYSSNVNVEDRNVSTKVNGNRPDSLLIKYSKNGILKWANSVQFSDYGSNVTSICPLNDGKIIVVGDVCYYYGRNTYYYFGIMRIYDKDGNLEWSKIYGLDNNINVYDNNGIYFTSVIVTKDGNIVVGGYYKGQSFCLDNGQILTNSYYNSYEDSFVFECNTLGEIKWIKNIGGNQKDDVTSIVETNDGKIAVGGYFNSSNLELENGKTLSNNGKYDGFLIKIAKEFGSISTNELLVDNIRKEYKITTEVRAVNGKKGGKISGENVDVYERVKYGDNSINEIKMTPNQDYEIMSITINDEDYYFTPNEDGTYTMPVFENVTEDKHIVVSYVLKNNKITINKVDEITNEGLPNTTFKLDQLEERDEPNKDEIFGNIVQNGQIYNYINMQDNQSNVIGELTNNGDYYFVKQDGKFVPTNSKTYQQELLDSQNEGNQDESQQEEAQGIQNSVANSYMKIDLTGKEGKYYVIVNAEISSQVNYDYGYVTINESQTAPTYSNSNGRFVYKSGTYFAEDYTSQALEGNKVYYLHFGYRKNASTDTDDDRIIINSVNVYGSTDNTYYFEENNGKYISNNQGKDSTIANSYFEVDLSEETGKYSLIVNAEISSQSSYDYGYVTVTESTVAPVYNSSTGRFVYISGTQSAKDYQTVLEGGKMYYLHLGYRKNESTSTGNDKFIVNSINIELNDSDFCHTEVTTNSIGQAMTQVPFGKYEVTEIKAPDGYWVKEEPIIIEFRSYDGAPHEFFITNEKKAKVIVHHYIENTIEQVADDEILDEMKIGTEYSTSGRFDLARYELIKDDNGEYVIPDNANGIYTHDDIEVIYYYTPKQIPLTVHHYIEGTSLPVELDDGSFAQDENYLGDEGEEYVTHEKENLAPPYEFVDAPENAKGIYEYDEVIVTYYYKEKSFEIKTKVKEHEEINYLGVTKKIKGGKISGEQERPYETVKYGQNSQKPIIITPDEDYIVKYIKVNGEEIEFTANQDGTVNLEQFINVIENKEIVVEFEKNKGKVIVHHYLESTTTPVPSKDGGVVSDEVKTGKYGESYSTKPSEEIADFYECVSTVGDTSGEYTVEDKEVIYYYKLHNSSVLVHHYLIDTTVKLDDDKLIKGEINEEYHTTPSNDVLKCYTCVTPTPNNFEGVMKDEPIEVIYYYSLNMPTLETDIEKTATANSEGEFDVEVKQYDDKGEVSSVNTERKTCAILTKEDDFVTYEIKYNITINDYIGDAEVEIVDTLPGEIEVSESDLAGGGYNVLDNTIHWMENYMYIDTYKNGTFNKEIIKTIRVKFRNQDVTKDLVNRVNGKVKLYYPFDYPIEDDGKLLEEIDVDKVTVKQEYKAEINIKKYWDDNNNEKAKRPESITVNVVSEPNVYSESFELNENNNWEIRIPNLNKYTDLGEKIVYSVNEELDNMNYRNNGIISTQEYNNDVLTYKYVLINEYLFDKTELNSNITKYGTQELTSSSQLAEYTIHFTSEINDYTGNARIQIVDNIPFKIDEANSVLDGGIYDEDSLTITWEQTLDNIDTENSGQYIVDIIKNISLKYEDIDLTQEKITNNVNGKIQLLETEQYDEATAEFTSNVNINGKVIIRYVDIETGEDITFTDENGVVGNYTNEISGKVGTEYTSEIKEIDNYKYIESTNNENGFIKEGSQVIIHYYIKAISSVIVKYVDEDSNEITEFDIIKGNKNDEYMTEPKEIEGYELIQIPENATGKMTEQPIEVVYVYKKKKVDEPKEEQNEELKEPQIVDELPEEKEEIQENNVSNEESEEVREEIINNIEEKITKVSEPEKDENLVVKTNTSGIYTGDEVNIIKYIVIIVIAGVYLLAMGSGIVVLIKKKNN